MRDFEEADDDTFDSLGCGDTAGVATSVAADGSNYIAVKIFPQEKKGEKKKSAQCFDCCSSGTQSLSESSPLRKTSRRWEQIVSLGVVAADYSGKWLGGRGLKAGVLVEGEPEAFFSLPSPQQEGKISCQIHNCGLA